MLNPYRPLFRVYGDGKKHGLGSYAITVEYLLKVTGLVWMVRLPRHLPPFWQEYLQVRNELKNQNSKTDKDELMIQDQVYRDGRVNNAALARAAKAAKR